MDTTDICKESEDWKKVLPEGSYQYKYLENYIDGEDFKSTFRCNIQTQEEVNAWLQMLSKNMKVEWKVWRTYPKTGRTNIFKRHYRCQHNSHRKLKDNSSTKKCSKVTGCTANIIISIKKYVKRCRAASMPSEEDKALPCIVMLDNFHNHPIQVEQFLKYRSVSCEMKEKVRDLLRKGHTPNSAYYTLKSELIEKDPKNYYNHAADQNYIPDIKYFYNVFYKEEHTQQQNDSLKATCPESFIVPETTWLLENQDVPCVIMEHNAPISHEIIAEYSNSSDEIVAENFDSSDEIVTENTMNSDIVAENAANSDDVAEDTTLKGKYISPEERKTWPSTVNEDFSNFMPTFHTFCNTLEDLKGNLLSNPSPTTSAAMKEFIKNYRLHTTSENVICSTLTSLGKCARLKSKQCLPSAKKVKMQPTAIKKERDSSPLGDQ